MERDIPPPLKTLLGVVMAAGLVASCSVIQELSPAGVTHLVGTDAQQGVELPTVVAVMPFVNETPEKTAADRMRKGFYNYFSSAPYVDVELQDVDEGIKRLEERTGKKAADMKPQEICQALGCDGLVYGKVTDYQKTFGGVYSRLRAEVELWMVNTRTGKEVVRVKDSVDYLEGGIPFSPLAAIMSALSSAANLREIQETRMVDELSSKLVAKIPMPKNVPEVRQPVIKELITNAAESPFVSGKIVRVGMHGEPGGIARFDIGNFMTGLPMRETEPGVYLGEYSVLPGDNTRDMRIIAYLRRPSGPESQWVDTSGVVAMDTHPPDEVAGLRADAYRDRVELSWDSLDNVPDLAAYRVLRSEQPLTGFQQIASTESNVYEDRTAQPGVLYHYRVVAVDKAGNVSEASATVSGGLAAGKPPATNESTILSGELKSDTNLSGVYLLKGQLTVPVGISLMIGPETTIVAEKDSGIFVQGRLTVDGSDGLVRMFSQRTEKWAGILLDGGHVTMKGAALSGALTGLMLKDAGGVVENASIADNDVGIDISGMSGVVVRNCWVAGNRTGIALSGTNAKIEQSAIVRNATGLSLRDFTGEISGNIIVDNEQNVSSNLPLKLDSNFTGQFREQGMPRTPDSGAGPPREPSESSDPDIHRPKN